MGTNSDRFGWQYPAGVNEGDFNEHDYTDEVREAWRDREPDVIGEWWEAQLVSPDDPPGDEHEQEPHWDVLGGLREALQAEFISNRMITVFAQGGAFVDEGGLAAAAEDDFRDALWQFVLPEALRAKLPEARSREWADRWWGVQLLSVDEDDDPVFAHAPVAEVLVALRAHLQRVIHGGIVLRRQLHRLEPLPDWEVEERAEDRVRSWIARRCVPAELRQRWEDEFAEDWLGCAHGEGVG